MEETVSQAKARLRANFTKPKGMKCPCCGQHAKLYKRCLNTGMLKALAWMCKEAGFNTDTVVDVAKRAPAYVTANREYGRLRNWDFIIPEANDDPTKASSGMWRVTDKAIQFIKHGARVKRCYFMFDEKIDHWTDDELVTFDEAKKNKFDIREIYEE